MYAQKINKFLLHIQPLLTQQSAKTVIDVGESHQSSKLLAAHWATTGSPKSWQKKLVYVQRPRAINNTNTILNKWNKYFLSFSLHLFFT